ncbi:MAG TPA: spore germination protein GerW family protein [Actinomycetota bacterium]
METTKKVDVDKTIEDAKDAITVRRVFGEPYVKNGVTLIPAARVQGGAGGGSGEGSNGEGRGGGAGFGLSAKPVGAFVIKGDEVSWRPAVDFNRVILGAELVTLVALLVARSIVRSRPSRTHDRIA